MKGKINCRCDQVQNSEDSPLTRLARNQRGLNSVAEDAIAWFVLADYYQNKAPKKAKKRIEGGSNVFSMFEQTQIQEFKEAFTIMDQNRDGFIDKADLRDTFAALGRLNVKNEELEEMVKEAPGPINFTVFLTMFGEKLKGTDPEETILNAFKIFDPEGKGHIKADYIKEMLMTQADRFSQEEINQMFAAFPPDVSGNLDYKNLCYVITHGEEKD
ncbi:myosin regulatory light chain 10 isoform X1 [Struthio camelus]|uniref:myosin regulatory light chain 10 isoform X1 n=1 Tax=Struthio camelus TaxID=8801 RepID=UPI00360410EC